MSQTPTASNGRQPLTPAPTFHCHDKQRRVVESDARYRVLKWGRRAGKNVTAAIDTVEYIRHPWRSEWGSDDPADVEVWWIAPSYDQANKHGFGNIRPALRPDWIESITRSKPYAIDLVNGATIEFRTYDKPETLQGSGIDRHIIDEADQMDRTLWDSDLEPMLMDTQGSAMFISKVYRPRSYFHDFFEYGQSSEYSEYASWHATSADNPFLDERPEDKRGTVPDHIYQQEYLAQVPDDGGQVFTALDERLFTADCTVETDIRRTRNDQIVGSVTPAYDTVGPYAVAVDFARSQDYRVTTVLDATGRLAHWHREHNESWDGIEDHIHATAEAFPGVVVPDASRDNKLISDLEADGLSVDPVDFSPKRKKGLIEDLATRIENGELTAPDVDAMDRLALELRQLERDVSAGGYTRYHAPTNEHDDCVDSLALAASVLQRLEAMRRQRDRHEEDDRGISYL